MTHSTLISNVLYPQIAKEMNFNLESEEAKDIASNVSSISITAVK